MKYVQSITVNPCCITIERGCWFFDISATVYPSNATCKSVTWSSSNSLVASVNYSNGWITGRDVGTATIYAHATDGSGVKGYCTVTVTAPVSVSSVTVNPSSLSMCLYEEKRLTATVLPANASDKSVIWCSSNPDIATVTYEGIVTAKQAGSVIITATSVDGCHTGQCSITVDDREKVTIQKDGDFFNVHFSSGLTWKSIGLDLSKSDILTPQEYWDRFNYNRGISYSLKQIAFLYLLDPLGIEYYVKDYPINRMSLLETLHFKDNVFKEIYGVKPRLFLINNDGTLDYYSDSSTNYYEERINVYSEAEVLFGSHTIINALTIGEFAVEVVISLFKAMIKYDEFLELGEEVVKLLFFSGSITNFFSGTASIGASEFLEGYIENSKTGEASSMFGWVSFLINTLKSALDLFTPENLSDITIYNKVNVQKYKTYFRIGENSELSMDVIINDYLITE